MGRWSHLDTDDERLPDGMQRIGYDADDQVYTYRDADGSLWEGAPGCTYGTLRRVGDAAPPLPVVRFDNHDEDSLEGSSDGEKEREYGIPDYYNYDDEDCNKTHATERISSQPTRTKLFFQRALSFRAARPIRLSDHDDEETKLAALPRSDSSSSSTASWGDEKRHAGIVFSPDRKTSTTMTSPVSAPRSKHRQRQRAASAATTTTTPGALSRLTRFLSQRRAQPQHHHEAQPRHRGTEQGLSGSSGGNGEGHRRRKGGMRPPAVTFEEMGERGFLGVR